MKLNGKLKAEVLQVLARKNKSNDGQHAEVLFVATLSRDEVKSILGEEFDALAFGAMVTRALADADGNKDGDELVHLADTVKPGRKLVMEMHVIKALGLNDKLQPEIKKIEPVQGAEEVKLTFAVGFPVNEESGLLANIGKTRTISFDPIQGTLPGMKSAAA